MTDETAAPRCADAVAAGIERAREALAGGDEAIAAHLTHPTEGELMTTEFDPRCTQQTYSHHCDERCWPHLSPYEPGDYVEDATGRLFQRIGTDADPRPWRYLTDRDHPTSYPSAVPAGDLVQPLTRLVRESDG